ncbi:hypothetical protein HYQ00_gp74 [Arthrobacter phage TripleJ]|uniref:Uncharacterized protein n=1 Tax=Arthrobacter phage TripleJ TaxID=2599838 RepID=A0A5J6TGY3_9CAUD|nr:hypothetical protein HYQ00_gp74 [Arthrobacter phage TripleJ]QFG09618.1 hypothetical protein PBI_TRIPLEJ_74 [Arthrobacter phage TripleJ]
MSRGVETVSAYEVGSVQFLNNLQALSAWVEQGVPVSGDKTALHRGGWSPEQELADDYERNDHA